MSAREKSISQEELLERAFGASLSQLYLRVTGPETSAALRRALELPSFLAVAEEQVDNT